MSTSQNEKLFTISCLQFGHIIYTHLQKILGKIGMHLLTQAIRLIAHFPFT